MSAVPRVAVKQLAAKADEAAARNAVFEAGAPVTGVGHLDHPPAPLPQALGHDADKVLGNVDDGELHRLANGAVDRLGYDLGVAQLELVTLAPHRLDENGQLKLASPEHDEGVRRLGLLHANGEVLSGFAKEAVAQVTAGQIFGLLALAGERRRVDADTHLDRRLLDVNTREASLLPARGRLDDRVADVDSSMPAIATSSPA